VDNVWYGNNNNLCDVRTNIKGRHTTPWPIIWSVYRIKTKKIHCSKNNCFIFLLLVYIVYEMFHPLYYNLDNKLWNSIKINNKLMIINRYFIKAENVRYFNDEYYAEWFFTRGTRCRCNFVHKNTLNIIIFFKINQIW